MVEMEELVEVPMLVQGGTTWLEYIKAEVVHKLQEVQIIQMDKLDSDG
jgi:6,7-dimethyl-8-ribityllumazine synthase